MATLNLLYKQTYDINESIKIYIPTVEEVIEFEDSFYDLLYILTAMPIDMMVTLDDAGIDFTAIDDYDLFIIMSAAIKGMKTELIFKDLDFSRFEIDIQNESVVLKNSIDDIIIDRAMHSKIASALRSIHRIEKNNRKPANPEAKEYMLERARAKLRRKAKQKKISQLEQLIISMVNTEQYKYNFEETKKLSIYQFNESVRQIIKKVDYDNLMHGVYTGTINPKELSQNDLNWLVHK